MPSSAQPLAYGSLFAGALLLIAGVSGSSVASVAQGHPDKTRAAGPAVADEAVSSSSPVAASPASTNTTGSWRATQAAIAHTNGWSLPDWNAVIAKESGGDPTSRNPSTGAFGIGQLNPENAADPFHPRPGSSAAKYAHLGALSTNPVLQIKAMAAYIHDRYGTPSAALAHEHAYGWY